MRRGIYLQETIDPLEGIRTRRNPHAGEQCGFHAVPGGEAHMQGFDHGADIGAYARGPGRGDSDRIDGLLFVKAKGLRRAHGGAEDSQGSRGVPTCRVVLRL